MKFTKTFFTVSTDKESQPVPDETESNPLPRLFPCLPFDAFPWAVLFLSSIAALGNFAADGYPSSLQTQFTEWFGGPDKYSQEDNLMLISVVSYPNIILPLFGTYLIDKVLGLRLGILIQVTGGLIGQVIFSLGIQYRTYWVCVVGRLIWGLMDNTYAPIISIVAQWFAGKSQSFAIGVLQAVVRFGSALSFLTLPIFAQIDVPYSLWVGSTLYVICFTGAIFLSWVDWYGEPRLKFEQQNLREQNVLESDPNTDNSQDYKSSTEISTLLKKQSEVSLADIKQLPWIVWFIIFFNTLFYISFTLIFSTGVIALQKTGQKLDPVTASQLFSIPSFVSLGLYPIAGMVADKFKIHTYGAILGSVFWVLGLIAFLLYMFDINIPLELTVVILGFGNTVYAICIYSFIPLLVPSKILATVYALISCSTSIATSITLPVLGQIQTLPSVKGTDLEHIIPVIIEIICSSVTIICTVIFMLWCHRNKDQIDPEFKLEVLKVT